MKLVASDSWADAQRHSECGILLGARFATAPAWQGAHRLTSPCLPPSRTQPARQPPTTQQRQPWTLSPRTRAAAAAARAAAVGRRRARASSSSSSRCGAGAEGKVQWACAEGREGFACCWPFTRRTRPLAGAAVEMDTVSQQPKQSAPGWPPRRATTRPSWTSWAASDARFFHRLRSPWPPAWPHARRTALAASGNLNERLTTDIHSFDVWGGTRRGARRQTSPWPSADRCRYPLIQYSIRARFP